MPAGAGFGAGVGAGAEGGADGAGAVPVAGYGAGLGAGVFWAGAAVSSDFGGTRSDWPTFSAPGSDPIESLLAS